MPFDSLNPGGGCWACDGLGYHCTIAPALHVIGPVSGVIHMHVGCSVCSTGRIELLDELFEWECTATNSFEALLSAFQFP